MHKQPTPNIPGGAPPRIEKRKNQLPQQETSEIQELSAQYLRERNEAIEVKTKAYEIELLCVVRFWSRNDLWNEKRPFC